MWLYTVDLFGLAHILDCQIYDHGSIPAPDFPFWVALPVHPAENGYSGLPWKLNAAERSADHIASLCAEI